MVERNALSNAQFYASQVEMLVIQARRISPSIEPLGKLEIAKGSLMSDVIFDNIFTDMAFHEKIKGSENDLNIYKQALDVQLRAVIERERGLKVELNMATERLEAARKELQIVRERAFEHVAGGLPDYSS